MNVTATASCVGAGSDQATRVLLVEDSAAQAYVIRAMLADALGAAVEVVHVARGSEAVARLAESAFDVVLLDLCLPDSVGLGTVDLVAPHAEGAPIVVLTGLVDDAVGVQALQRGVQDYLVKGQVTGELLRRSIRYAIERHRLQAELRNLSLVDSLTGLHNHRGFLALAERHLRRTRRAPEPFLLVFADVDGLKEVNDVLGHREGDRALARAGEALRKTFRDTDILARLGGDEFAVLAMAATEACVPGLRARLRACLAASEPNDPSFPVVTLSVGVACQDLRAPASLEALMTRADEAMYQEKRARRQARRPALLPTP